MLKTIQRVTGQRITMEQLPTVADLRARRLELTRAALHESLVSDDLEPYRVVVETLSAEFDPLEVALAAVKLAHESVAGSDDELDIPTAAPAREAKGAAKEGSKSGRARTSGGGMTRLFIGRGRKAGIRPKDLVGAIANESSLTGREIGAIEIADKFSLVEVPAPAADEVVAALKKTTIKGKKATVRLEGDRPARTS